MELIDVVFLCRSLPLSNHNCQNLFDMKDNHLNIAVLGGDLLATQLVSEIQVSRSSLICFIYCSLLP